MTVPSFARRLPLAVALLSAVALIAAGSAFAHARVLPETALAGGQLYALSVPNEFDDASTTKVVLTVPEGFSIGLIAVTPGWTHELQTTGSGEESRVSSVTWTGPPGGSSAGGLFQFTGRTTDPGSYTFAVEQSYSNGEVVDWAGDEDSDTPASVVETKTSLGGGGGTSALEILALALGALGVLLGGIALATRGGRQLA